MIMREGSIGREREERLNERGRLFWSEVEEV